MDKPSYYAIIPASVRYDSNLKANSKLLYGEITSLANQKGYCYASNQYFADLYCVSKETVSRWVKQLIKNGHITSELIYKEGTKEIVNRYLRICQGGTDEKVNRGIDKKSKDNNTSINNTSINNKKEKVFNFRKELINLGLKEELASDWLKVRKNKKATNTETAFKRFVKEFEKSELGINEIVEICIVKNWAGFENKWLLNAQKQNNQPKKEVKLTAAEALKKELGM